MNDETLAFSSQDVEAFALLSGDSNPIHVDPIAARRSMFGAPVVHGVALVCTALDRALRDRPPAGIAKLSATFSLPLYVGAELGVRGDDLDLVLESEGEKIGSVKARLTEAPHPEIELRPPAPEAPVDLPFEALANASGSVGLGFDRALLDRLFPALGARLHPVQIAELLATTRIVGMLCPGLWSLYAGLELEATRSPTSTFEYRVSKADARLNLLDVAVSGPTLQGTLRTFVRPKPEVQVDLQSVSSAVRPQEFFGMRALVVGGSRGLGELTAKCIAAGGGEVVITHASGARDAERVVQELRARDLRARAIHLDVTRISDLGDVGSPTHLFYFATPHIPIGRGKTFSHARFEELSRFYVTGFADVVRAVRKLGKDPLVALYPSTVFLDEMPKGAEEYCAAKAAGEALALSLAKNLPALRVVSPRLPRVRTDQTIGILPVEAEDTLTVVLRMLRELERSLIGKPQPMSPRLVLAIEVAALLFVVVAANLAVAVYWPDDREPESSGASRPPHVYALPHDPSALPPAPASDVVLLVGNSHMYTLPGAKQGDRIAFDVGRTLLDEVAAELSTMMRGPHHVVRLSSPDFLPFEMLVRTSQLLQAGWRPKVVILGLHWTNVARGAQLRPQIRRVFKNQAALDDLLARLAKVDEGELVRTAVENEAREIQKELESERTRSDVDEADLALTEELREHVPVLRQSVALRADLYRMVTGLQGRFAKEGAVKYNFAVIEEDRRFNVAVVRALLRVLHDAGAEVVLYRAPVRQDLPPMTDPAREEETMGALLEYARELGMATFDARTTAADDEWGWHGQFPDRFHFIPAAHRRLASQLVAEAERAGFWGTP